MAECRSQCHMPQKNQHIWFDWHITPLLQELARLSLLKQLHLAPRQSDLHPY